MYYDTQYYGVVSIMMHNIREALHYHNPWWRGSRERLENLLARTSLADIGPLFERKEVLAITGVRRCGKSSLMRLMIGRVLAKVDPTDVLYVACDDPALTGVSVGDLIDVYEEIYPPTGQRYVFLDEVQANPGWERWVKRYHDAGEPIKFVVSGSNSSLLSSEFSTALTGRQLTYRLRPLDLRERLMFEGISVADEAGMYANRARIRNALDEHLRHGGFPEVVLAGDDDIRLHLLKDYHGTILAKDVALRHDVREGDALLRLSHLLITNIGRPASATSLGRAIGLNTRTVQSYMAHLGDAFLMSYVHHFSYSLKAQLGHPVKPYCVDVGLRNAVSFRFSEDRGWLMENLALLKLEREGPVYYWKDGKGEVDFVLYDGIRPVHAFQVCHDLGDRKVRRRELDALARAMRELRLKRGTIVTWDEEGVTDVEGMRIELVPMWRWLLE
jgi:predicted AAA+ superfamily ATPase